MIRGFDFAVFVFRYFNPSLYLYVGVLCVAVFVSLFSLRCFVGTPVQRWLSIRDVVCSNPAANHPD